MTTKMHVKQASAAQSRQAIKELKKSERKIVDSNIAEGLLLLFWYAAKNDKVIYDKHPMVLVLRTSRTHMLGLNFHWLPFALRMQLLHQILRFNKTNIKNNKPLEISYKKIKPYIRKSGLASCVRLYIKSRMSRKGNVIPPNRLLEVAQLQMQAFTGIPEQALYNIVRKKR